MTEQERPFSIQIERSIAERAAGGDSSAVAELYDGYERQLYGYCHRICRNPEDAADATQDAFCSVIQRLPGLDTQNLNFAAYLFTTARNACMDIIKQRGRAEPTDEVLEDPFATAAIDTDPERQLLTGDQQRAAREASDRLPETQRTVLALREVSELSYDEIAETMGMKPNAVAQLISRARLNFYKQLRTGAVVISPLDDAAQRAIELTVQRQDGKINTDDLDWLQAHLKENESSRINAEAIQESAALYRVIAPAVVIASLRDETIQRAIESIGSDPNADSSSGDGGSSSASTSTMGTSAGVSASVGATLGAKPEQASANNQSSADEAVNRRSDQRRAAGALAVLIVIALLGGSSDSEQVAPEASAATVEAPTAQTTAAKSGGEPRKGSNDKPVSSKAAAEAPTTTSQNSQTGGDKPVKSGGNSSNGPEKEETSGGKKTTSGGQAETPPAEEPAPPTATPPAAPPTSTPPPPPPPKKPPGGPIDFCSTNCTPPPPPVP